MVQISGMARTMNMPSMLSKDFKNRRPKPKLRLVQKTYSLAIRRLKYLKLNRTYQDMTRFKSIGLRVSCKQAYSRSISWIRVPARILRHLEWMKVKETHVQRHRIPGTITRNVSSFFNIRSTFSSKNLPNMKRIVKLILSESLIIERWTCCLTDKPI